jgi:hypothetical protein
MVTQETKDEKGKNSTEARTAAPGTSRTSRKTVGLFPKAVE